MAVGNRDATFKGLAQNLTYTGTQGKRSDLKEAWARPTCWPWRSPGEVRNDCGSPCGLSSFHRVDAGACGSHCRRAM